MGIDFLSIFIELGRGKTGLSSLLKLYLLAMVFSGLEIRCTGRRRSGSLKTLGFMASCTVGQLRHDMTFRFEARIYRSISFQRFKVEKFLTSTFSHILGSGIMAASKRREVKATEVKIILERSGNSNIIRIH